MKIPRGQDPSILKVAVRGLQVAKVIQLQNDPEKSGRIKIELPLTGTREDSVWARMSTLDAGKERGSFFLPEIGDEVIVGFINDDPRNPIVLGMLYSSANPPPIAATDANHEKGFVTRSKMKIIFNDDEKSLSIETPAGNKVLMDDSAAIVSIQDQNGNKLIMDANGITIESIKRINIKAGTDCRIEASSIESKADASLKAIASGSMELKCAGTLTAQGSLVKIN